MKLVGQLHHFRSKLMRTKTKMTSSCCTNRKRSKSLILHRGVIDEFKIHLPEEICSTFSILLLTSSDRPDDSRNGSLDLMI